MSAEMWTIKRILDWTREYFARVGIEEPRLDAEVLLAEVLGVKRLDLFLRYGEAVPEEALVRFRNFVKRRAQWEPLAYIIGRRTFINHEFIVTPDVLIPRPETELLVDNILTAVRAAGFAPPKVKRQAMVLPWSVRPEYLEQKKLEDDRIKEILNEAKRLREVEAQQGNKTEKFSDDENGKFAQESTESFGESAGKTPDKMENKTLSTPLKILDLGTGSGCILLSLLAELPAAAGVAADISFAALSVARENAKRLGVLPRVRFYESDLGARLPKGIQYDIIVSNPPYVPTAEIETLARDVRREPRQALDGGVDGLDIYRRLLLQVPFLLKRDGFLALEIGKGEGKEVEAFCHKAGFEIVALVSDFSEIDRMVFATREGSRYADFTLGLKKSKGL